MRDKDVELPDSPRTVEIKKAERRKVEFLAKFLKYKKFAQLKDPEEHKEQIFKNIERV